MIERLKEIVLGKKRRGHSSAPTFGEFREIIKEDVRDLKDLSEIHKKLDELLEIKELYRDMLDWMLQTPEKRVGKESGNFPNIPECSGFSPRLNQLIETLKQRGELSSLQASEVTGLSHNRCSELLNLLYKANYVDKVRVGHEVFYRLKQ